MSFSISVVAKCSQDTMDIPRILAKQLLKEVSKAEAVALIEEMSKDSGNCMGGKIVSIEVSDHIIIGFSDHVSLKDKGLM